ncbi:hypothetical protein MASR2M18_07880 [Ignavibacteria bacterium]|nr:hypothetical protein [Bacteroidota bacterium]MCZ2132917.1 hypothetical protein [Bacteroidota bacterium]
MKKVISIIVIFILGALNAQAQWTQGKGLYGSKIISLAVSGTIVFAGMDAVIVVPTMVIHGLVPR